MAIVLCLFQKVLTFPDGSERCSLLRVEANLLQSHYTAHYTAGCHANGKKCPHLQQSKGKPQIPTNKGTFICGYMWIYVYICMCTCVHNMYYTESGVHLTHVVVSECMQGWMHKVCLLPTYTLSEERTGCRRHHSKTRQCKHRAQSGSKSTDFTRWHPLNVKIIDWQGMRCVEPPPQAAVHEVTHWLKPL